MSTTTMEKPARAEVTRAEQTPVRPTYRPNVDIIERDDELVVLADMPGARADDIDIEFDNGALTIFAKVDERQPQDTAYLFREYGVGDYRRTFEVGEAIDAERINAEFECGVLTLHLPKTEQARPRRITVKTKQ